MYIQPPPRREKRGRDNTMDYDSMDTWKGVEQYVWRMGRPMNMIIMVWFPAQ